MTDLEFLDQAPHKMRFSATLDCAPERAFAVLADPASWPLWFQDCKGCEWDTPPPHGLGAERTIHLQLMRIRERVVAFEPGVRFAFAVVRNTLPLTKRMVEDFRLTALDGHTRVDWIVAYEPSLLIRLSHPLARLVFGRMFRNSIAGLKRFTRPAGV
jgi:hypothetical protein